MSNAIEGLKPELIWKYFAEISRIPRCSKNETAIAKYVMDTAKKLGLAAKQDRAGSVVVKKSASSGRAHAPGVCLQSHLDMVCEKNADVKHDFAKDPIKIVRKGNLLMADGTTLGADNGIGVATNLAVMEDKSLEHGPVELLFTVDEETGLTGASNLEPGFVESRTLINIDSEEEGALYVGCAGGRDSVGTWGVTFEPTAAQMVAAELSVKGLRGGHSGLDIDKGRGNAIKILGRTLMALAELGTRVASLNGGNKRNAIPREAQALVFVPKAKLEAAQFVVSELAKMIKAELAGVEPDFALVFEAKGTKKGRVIKKPQIKKILQTVAALPHGVMKMSAAIPGLVETSTNVAVIATDKKAISLATSQRSSVASEINDLCSSVACVFELGGAKLVQSAGYPGWKPNLDSQILKIAVSTYQSLFGKEPAVKAIHAGLECGIIGEKYPGIDMVSCGPTLEAVHSPDEKIFIDTVDKYWRFLTGVLKNCA